MKSKATLALSLCALLMLSTPSTSHAAYNAAQSQAVFDQFTALVGTWEGSYADARAPHRVTYRLIANGSALLKEWQMSPTRASMTVYTLDNGQLVATHYCPQKTQPTLALKSENAKLGYHFKLIGGGNLKVRGLSHQAAFTMKIIDATTMVRSEYYVENGKRLKAGDEGEAVTYKRIPQ